MGEHQKPGALFRRIAPSVPLELILPDASGKSTTLHFRLCFDFWAARSIEKRFGISVMDTRVWQETLGPDFICALFWGAVVTNHPEYDTKDENDKLTDEGPKAIASYIPGNTVEILGAITKAYNYWLPSKKNEEETSADPQQPPEKESPAAKKAPIVGVGQTTGRSRGTTSASATKSSTAST